MKKRFPLLFAATIIILTSCYYDKEDLLYGGTCDTGTVTYTQTVTTILKNYGCISCHSGSNPSGSINLESFANVKTTVSNGKLYGSITHATGFVPMPDGAAALTACDIKKIKAWIDSGALNN